MHGELHVSCRWATVMLEQRPFGSTDPLLVKSFTKSQDAVRLGSHQKAVLEFTDLSCLLRHLVLGVI